MKRNHLLKVKIQLKFIVFLIAFVRLLVRPNIVTGATGLLHEWFTEDGRNGSSEVMNEGESSFELVSEISQSDRIYSIDQHLS